MKIPKVDWKLPDWLPPMTWPETLAEEIAPQPLSTQSRWSNQPKITVAQSDRWFIAGMTGSGKTTFTKALISQFRFLWPSMPVYIVDSKNVAKDFGSWRGIVEQSEPPKLLREANGIQIWRPPSDDLEAYDEYFHRILETRKPAIVLVNELASISDKSGQAVQGYQKLQKQGRGHNILTLTESQEMSYIDSRATNQMTHFVRFALLGDYNQRKANGFLGREKQDSDPPHKYGFWHVRMDERPRRPIYYPSYKHFF